MSDEYETQIRCPICDIPLEKGYCYVCERTYEL